MQVYDLLIAEDYDNRDGEKRTNFTNVGAAFPQKNGDGFSLQIRPGLAVSGRVLMLPRKAKDEREAS